MKTWTTYVGGTAITWQQVGLIAKPVSVRYDPGAAAIAVDNIEQKPMPLCVVCSVPVSRRNASYCTPCRTKRDREQGLTRSAAKGRAQGKRCACGAGITNRAKRCRACHVASLNRRPTKAVA
jgi:hypothetical protein